MFIKETHRTLKDGTRVTYLHLVESQWDARRKVSRHKVLKNLGRKDQLDPSELTRLTTSCQKYLGTSEQAAPQRALKAPETFLKGILNLGQSSTSQSLLRPSEELSKALVQRALLQPLWTQTSPPTLSLPLPSPPPRLPYKTTWLEEPRALPLLLHNPSSLFLSLATSPSGEPLNIFAEHKQFPSSPLVQGGRKLTILRGPQHLTEPFPSKEGPSFHPLVACNPGDHQDLAALQGLKGRYRKIDPRLSYREASLDIAGSRIRALLFRSTWDSPQPSIPREQSLLEEAITRHLAASQSPQRILLTRDKRADPEDLITAFYQHDRLRAHLKQIRLLPHSPAPRSSREILSSLSLDLAAATLLRDAEDHTGMPWHSCLEVLDEIQILYKNGKPEIQNVEKLSKSFTETIEHGISNKNQTKNI